MQVAVVGRDQVGALLRLRFVQARLDFRERPEYPVGVRNPMVRFNVAMRVPVGEPGDDDQKGDRDAEAGGDLGFDAVRERECVQLPGFAE